MKVLLLADPHGPGDEGARNVSKRIHALLSGRYEVLSFPAPLAIKRIGEIRRFKPDVIHSLHGPSKRTFYLLAVLYWVCPKAVCFMSLTQPDINLFENPGPLWRRFNFIHMLTQDAESEQFFSALGFPVHPVPNGVDLERFKPVAPVLPESLESKLSSEKKLLLHVGHVKASRGLETLAELGNVSGWQSVMLTSTRFPMEPDVEAMLKQAGCIVVQEYVDDLPGLYSHVDAYLFPVSELDGSIDVPLTVLEALACNCQVISTPFKGLPRFLPDGDGIQYYSSLDEARSCLDIISADGDGCPRTRVLEMSWNNIVDQITGIYQSINRV